MVVRALCKDMRTILQIELHDGRVVTELCSCTGCFSCIYRALETSVAMIARIKEKRTRVGLKIQYERLPWFCYACGYIGHQVMSCARKFRW